MTWGSVLDPKLPHGTGAEYSDSVGGRDSMVMEVRFWEDEK